MGLFVTELPDLSAYGPTVLAPGMIITTVSGGVTKCGTFYVRAIVLVTEDEP